MSVDFVALVIIVLLVSSTLEPAEISRLPFRSVVVSNILRYYVVLGLLDLSFIVMFGVLTSSAWLSGPLLLLGLAVATLPFIAFAGIVVTWLSIGYAWLRRVAASATYASFAFVGMTWITQLIDRVTNHRGLWDLPIFLAVLAGFFAGLAVKERTQRPRFYRAPSPPVV